MAKILKNTTAMVLNISDTGVTIPASPGSYTIPPQDYALWAASLVTQSHVSSGAIVVNDGAADLIVPNGLDLLKGNENEAGLMIARKIREHTGVVFAPSTCPCEYSTLSFNNTNRTLTWAPKSPYTEIEILIDDVLYKLVGNQTVQIADVEGEWYIYTDKTLVLQASQTPFTFDGQVFVAIVYWDATNKRAVTFGDERHGATMDQTTHYYNHRTEGMKIESTVGRLTIGDYIDTGNGSLNSHAQYSVSDGDVFDEDLVHRIRHSASPTAPFQQVLTPAARLPVYYMTGVNSWRRKDPTAYPIYENPPGTAYYNNYSGGVWSLASTTNDWFFATWLIFTNDLQYPVASILGQRQDSNLIAAINNNTRSALSLPNFFTPERYFYRKLIWQTNTTYANAPKARLRYVSTVSEIAPTNDRYAVICSYNGNAGTGKYLEFYPGQSSDTSPFPLPEISYIRTIVLSTVANSTGTISFYRHTDLTTPLFAISLSNASYTKLDLTYILNADDEIVAKVSSGSLNKPAITVFIQTSL